MDGQNFFGTDGIRGKVGELPITVDSVLKLGWAVGRVFGGVSHSKILIGKDTRISGYLIESALQAGLSAAGANVYLSGPMPTPAIAYLTRTIRAKVGMVISASHNLYEDNGVKFFNQDGFKIEKKYIEQINHYLTQPIKTETSAQLGKSWRVHDAEGRYIEFCKSSIPHRSSFQHLKIVIDCANGATYRIAPHVFSELGAHVIPIHHSPDGFNINAQCGSTHPAIIQKAVLEQQADIGIAFDGDGDRILMVDHTGEVLDGDDILYIIAKNMLTTHRLTGGVIGTVMSNLGLEQAINDLGLAFVRVAVGDQHIIEGLLEKKWMLGGEASGHIVCLNVNTTGDGIIAALQVLQAMKNTNLTLHELKKSLIKLPQKLINVATQNKVVDLTCSPLASAIKEVENDLGNEGRVVVRKSGTEPLIRIMVEGKDESRVNHLCLQLKETVEDILNKT